MSSSVEKAYGLQPSEFAKNYKLYTLCTLILSNPPHLTIGLKLILTQNEL
jgi:hypothetical protein